MRGDKQAERHSPTTKCTGRFLYFAEKPPPKKALLDSADGALLAI
jgi:hypothetical protein